MMSSEITTAVQEGLKLIVVIVDNKGYSSVGRVSEQVAPRASAATTGSAAPRARMTARRSSSTSSASAGGWGRGPRGHDAARAPGGPRDARAGTGTVCIVVQTDWDERVRGYANSWWEMATPQVSEMPAVNAAREEFDRNRAASGT